uniref:Putative serine/threonine-protein kinase n=1 Tax=Anopheles darlingi TaxID=43151 RepID=A0A2M4CMR1_ANODA
MKIGLGLEQIRARKRTDWTAVPSISGVAEQSVTSDHHTSLNDHPSESGDLRSGQNASVLLRHRRLMYKRPGGFTSGSTKLLNTIRRRKHLLLRGRTSGNLSTQSVGHHHRRTVRTVSEDPTKRTVKPTKLSKTKKCLSKHSIEKQICAQNVELVGTAVPVSVEASEEPETVPVETSDQSASAEESVSSEVRGGEEEEKKQEAIKRETLLGELKKDLKEYCSVHSTAKRGTTKPKKPLEELERSVDETNDGTDVDQSNSQDSGAEAINQPASSSAAPASSTDATITDEGDLDVTSNQKETEEEHVKREAPESPPSPGEALDGRQSRSSPVATVDSEAAVAQQKKKSGYTPLKTSKSDILDPTYTCEIKLEPLEERKASFVDSLLDKFNLPPPTMPLTNGLGGDGGDDGTGEQSQQSRRCLRDRTKIAARPRYIEIPEEPRRVRVSKVFGKLHKSLNLDLDSTNSNSSTEFYGFDEGEVVKLDKPSLPGLLPTPIVKKSQPYAPFLAYGTCISDKEEDSRGASPSSTATIRSDLLRENGLLSYGSHPPRLQCPLRPSDMIRPRTVAQKRILLEHLNDVRYPMIDNESKIYRFLMMKTKNQDEQLDFERMKELQDQQIPFTRGTWRALSWLRTEKDRNNLQAVCIDGRWTNLTGCRGNHSNKLLIRKKMYSGVVQSSAGRRIHYINNCHCPAQFPPGVSIDLSLIEPPKKPAILCASKKEEVDDDERKLSIGRPKLREMKRLNATIIESPSQPTLGGTGGRDSSVTDPSAKSVHRPCDPLYCAKGCICDVLGWSMSAQATISESRTSHCQRIDCVLGCVCGYEQKQVNHTHEVKMKSNSAGGGLISERSSLTSADVKYLREKATARLAKEEREFTPTVILTDNATVLVRNTESETRRQKKKPKKYDDYYNENSMQKLLSGRFGFEDYVPATPPHLPSEEMALQVKPLPLADRMRHAHVLLYNLSALTVLEPWCMVHQLYRCYCGGTATQGKPFSFLEENCVDQTSWESSPSTTTTNSPCSSGNNNNNNNTLSSSRMGKMMITNGSSVLLPEPNKAADNGNAALPYLAPFPRKRLYSFEKITSEAARPGRPGRPPHTSTCSSGGSSARKRDSSEESYKPPNERRVKRKQKANQTTNTTAPSCPSAANGVELESGPRRKGIMRRRFSTGDWVRPRQLRKLMEEQQHAADAQYKIVARPAPKAGISNIVLKRIPHKESPPKLTASPPKRLTNGTTNHRDDNELERTPLKPSPTVSQTAQIVLSDSSEDEHLPVVDGRRKQKFTSTKTHVVRPSAVPTNGSNSVMTEATSVTNSTVASSTDTTTSKSTATNSTTNITNSNSTNSVTTELAPTLVVTQRQLRELIEREKVNPSPVRAGQRRLQNVHLVDPTNGYDVLCTPTMRLVICGKKKAFVDVRMLRRPGVLDSLVSHSNAMVYIVKIPINTTNTIPSATLGDVTMTPGCTVPPVTNATQGPPTMMPPTTVRRILDRRHSVAHVRTPSSAPFQQQSHSSAFRAPHARRHEGDDDRDEENSVEGIAPPDQDQLFSLMRHVSTLLSRDTPCLSQVKAGILHICRWTALVTAFAIGQADIIDVTYQNGNKQTLIWINRRPNTPLLLRNYKSYTSARQLWRRYGQRAMQKDHATLQASLLYRMIISGIDNPLSNRHLGLILYGGLHYWLFCGFIKTPKDQKSLPLAQMKAALPIRELSAFGLLKSFSDRGSYSSADVHYRRPLEESQIDPEINPVRRSVPSSTTGGMPVVRVIPTSSLLEKPPTPTGSSNPSDTKQTTTGSAKSIGRPSNIHIAPACPSTDSTDRQDRSRHCRWIKLYIVDDFTDMYIPSWRYCIQHSQLMKAIQHANRHRAVRCLEFTLSPNNRSTKRSRILPRIYAAPYQDNSIYVGPFPITQTQTDIMLCVASDGLLYTREEHERRHGIAVDSGAKRTKGLWIEMAPEAMELLQRQLDRTRVKRNAEGVPRAKASTCFISPATTVTLNSKPPTIIDTPAGTVNPVRPEPKGVTDRNATTAASAIAATDQRSLLKRNQPPVPSGIATSKPAVPGAVAEGKPTITRTPLHANVRRIAIPSTDLDRFTVGPKKSRVDDDDDDDDDDEIEKDGDDYEKRKESDIDAKFSSSCARSVPFSAKKAEACADPDNDFVAEPAKKDDTDRLAQLLEQTMQYTEQEQRKVEHLIKSSRPIPEDKVSVATEISATPTTTATSAKGGEQDRTIVVPITMNRKRKSVDVINGDSAGGDGEGKQQQQQQQPRPVVPVQAKFIRIADSTRITTKELRGPISIVSAAPTGGPAKTITFSLQKNGLSRMSIASATPAGPIATPAVVRLQRNALSRVSLPLPSEPSTSSAACAVQAVAKPTTQPQTPPTTTTQLGSKPASGSEVQILRKIPMVRRNSVLTLHDIKQYTGKYKIIIPPKPTADGDPTAASKPNPNGITGKFRFKPTGSSPKKRKLPTEGTVTLPAASTAGGLEAKSVDAKLSDSLPTGQPVSSGQKQHQRVKKKGNPAAPTQRTVDPSSLSKPCQHPK